MHVDLYLGGDTNIDMLANTNAQKDFQSTINEYGLSNVIRNPTRVTVDSASLLDVFITNIPNDLVVADVVYTDISDHLGIILLTEKNTMPTNYVQNITPANREMFRRLVAQQNWNESTSSDTAYSAFITIFQQVYNECFPMKKISKPPKARKPWLTHELLNMIKHKNELYAKFVKSRDPNVLKQFRLYRNRLTSSLRAARNSYFINVFWNVDQRRSDIIWRKVNTLLHPSNRASVPDNR